MHLHTDTYCTHLQRQTTRSPDHCVQGETVQSLEKSWYEKDEGKLSSLNIHMHALRCISPCHIWVYAVKKENAALHFYF